VYPNKMDFPIMEDFGVAPPPLGMLEVAVGAALMSTQMLDTHWRGLHDVVVLALQHLWRHQCFERGLAWCHRRCSRPQASPTATSSASRTHTARCAARLQSP
jgi:hypothetical protein